MDPIAAIGGEVFLERRAKKKKLRGVDVENCGPTFLEILEEEGNTGQPSSANLSTEDFVLYQRSMRDIVSSVKSMSESGISHAIESKGNKYEVDSDSAVEELYRKGGRMMMRTKKRQFSRQKKINADKTPLISMAPDKVVMDKSILKKKKDKHSDANGDEKGKVHEEVKNDGGGSCEDVSSSGKKIYHISSHNLPFFFLIHTLSGSLPLFSLSLPFFYVVITNNIICRS